MKHELFDELDAVNPRWQSQYSTLPEAARAYGLHDLLQEYLTSPTGQEYSRRMAGVIDWEAVSRRNRAQRDAELGLANTARRQGVASVPSVSYDDQEGWDE